MRRCPANSCGREGGHRMRSKWFLSSVVALGLVVTACSSDKKDAETTTTMATTTTAVATTTTTLPSAPVSATFATAVDAATATQAADTMTRRLEKLGYPGSTATVTSRGAGLDIRVVAVATAD